MFLVWVDQREMLLNDLRKSLSTSEHRTATVGAALEVHIDRLTEEAMNLLEQTHPDMPEVLELTNLLHRRGDLDESEVVAYIAELEASISKVRGAGLNALERYRVRVTEDTGYLFAGISDIEQIGTAIRMAAKYPEEYSGRLWSTGEDVLLRLMVSDNEPMMFYDRFCYPAVARALQAASERSEIFRVLSVLDSEFLPPTGGSRSERIRMLLSHSSIQHFFREAGMVGVSRLVPERFAGLQPEEQRTQLTLLGYAEELLIPPEVILQWAALLHTDILPESELHRQTSYLLLVSLSQSGHHLSLYYSLQTLGKRYPDLWDEPVFRPMLLELMSQALRLGSDARCFLIDLGMLAETARLAAGDFGSEFLLASLSHYAAVRWGHTALLNRAWAVWNRLSGEYPTLVDVLQRNLQGEQFSDDVFLDFEFAKEQYFEIVAKIAQSCKGFGLPAIFTRHAIDIYRWYVHEYVHGWLRQLQAKKVSQVDLKGLMTDVSRLRDLDDFVEACPLHERRSLHSTERRVLNNRLFVLMKLLSQGASLRLQLLQQDRLPMSYKHAVLEELRIVSERCDTAAWAAEHLLQPVIPFIVGVFQRT